WGGISIRCGRRGNRIFRGMLQRGMASVHIHRTRIRSNISTFAAINQRMREKSFTGNVLKLMSGTTLAQVVPFLLLPLLTRLYSPADFASFEQYLMAIQVLSVLATLKYEFAIMQPKSDADARQILYMV